MHFTQKFDLLKRLYTEHKCDSFVETGTYEGRMSLAMANIAPTVRTIELSVTLHQLISTKVDELVKNRLLKPNVVTLICGNSSKELPGALDGLTRPLVWLDAHWSDGKTARDDSGSDTPIVAELNAIKNAQSEGVVVIDDLWCFNGKNGYPTFERLREIVRELWPTATLTRVDECVWFQIDPA